MFLTFFDRLREEIVDLVKNMNLGSIVTLLTGIVIGFVLCAVVYLCIMLSALKKENKKIIAENVNVENEIILKLIRSSKNQFIEESDELNTGEKMVLVKDIALRLINDIAKCYYPNSEYPIYELNVDELLMLCHYITDRINSMFKGPVMKHLKKLKLSQVVKMIDLKKKIDENKFVKAASKAKVPKILSSVTAVLNVFNPVYWVKKIMINTTMLVATKKIALTIIDVIGEETTKVYSKSVFNKENNLAIDVQSSIDEIEHLVEGEN